MTKTAVIGAGAMGLASAYHLLKAGHQVEVFEADDRPGGMAAHFDLDGLSIERFYHFICKADRPAFVLMAELGLSDALKWRPTSMCYFYGGRVYPWGDPISLLRFPHLDLLSKIRYGLHMFTSTKRSDWSKLDRLHADDWVRRWGGERVWTVLWEKLFTLKFFEESHDISAAWLWTRIKRVGTSRLSIFQEEMGYIEGGSETLVRRLVERIEAMGGRIHLSTPVQQVLSADGRVSGLLVDGTRRPFGAVICTAPLVLLPRLIPDLPEAVKSRYAALRNIGVVCVVHKLRRAVGKDFWINTNDPRIDVPGVIEFSNLRPTGADHVVYAPYYMPVTNPKWALSDQALIEESFGYLKLINPEITDADRLASSVARLRHAQPVCPPGYAATLPPIQTAIAGLQVADTSTYYPQDRGIAESVRVAKEMAAHVAADPLAEALSGLRVADTIRRPAALLKHLYTMQFAGFLVVGGSAAVLQWSSSMVLSLWLNFSAAIVVAYAISTSFAFCLNSLFVFRRSTRPWPKQARDFIMINLAFFPLVWAVSIGLEHALGSLGVRHAT